MPIDPNYFPFAELEGYQETSPEDPSYNCIGWAAGDSKNWWDPYFRDGYWPNGVPRAWSVAALIALFQTLGYTQCTNGVLEQGYEKVALYWDGFLIKHAAKQLSNGSWVSKLGPSVDIEHNSTRAVEGPAYGTVIVFLRRQIPP